MTAIEKILSNLCNIPPKRIDFPFHVIDKQGEKTLHFIAVESQRERLSNYVLTANENRLSIKCNRRSIGIDSPFYVIYVNENRLTILCNRQPMRIDSPFYVIENLVKKH